MGMSSAREYEHIINIRMRMRMSVSVNMNMSMSMSVSVNAHEHVRPHESHAMPAVMDNKTHTDPPQEQTNPQSSRIRK